MIERRNITRLVIFLISRRISRQLLIWNIGSYISKKILKRQPSTLIIFLNVGHYLENEVYNLSCRVLQ